MTGTVYVYFKSKISIISRSKPLKRIGYSLLSLSFHYGGAKITFRDYSALLSICRDEHSKFCEIAIFKTKTTKK